MVVELLRATDPNLYRRVARKMLNHLAWSGVAAARELLQRLSAERSSSDENRPLERAAPEDVERVAGETFALAAEHLPEPEVASLIQTWIREDRVDFLIQALETPYTSLVEIGNALEPRLSPGSVTIFDGREKDQFGRDKIRHRDLLTRA